MKQTAIFPGRYVQAEGALAILAEEVQRLGSNTLIIAGRTAEAQIIPAYLSGWRKLVNVTVAPLGGETSEEVYDFCESVGLPTRLEDIGVAEASDADLQAVAEAACSEGETIYHESCPISTDAVVAALKMADQLGRSRRK